jgi:molecular chaperone GrpE (heat shock protein)
MSEHDLNVDRPIPDVAPLDEPATQAGALNPHDQEVSTDIKSTPVLQEYSDLYRELRAAVAQLAAEVTSLQCTVKDRLRYDKAKEEAFDRLYAELDELKKNSAFDQVRPLYLDLILLFDRIENIGIDSGRGSPATLTLATLFKTLSEELLEILSRREVEIIQTASPKFDPITQRAIGTESAATEAENNEVARVVRKGFRFRDRVVRAEEVIVKKYRETVQNQKGE